MSIKGMKYNAKKEIKQVPQIIFGHCSNRKTIPFVKYL